MPTQCIPYYNLKHILSYKRFKLKNHHNIIIGENSMVLKVKEVTKKLKINDTKLNSNNT